MKLLPSPSISSSSSNAMSFDSNVCTSKRATASCLSGIFSRLLCSRGLPTHPSDQITDTTWMSLPCDIKQEHCVKSFEAPATDPGIVAKLMGLEAFPDHATSILRSRSMNSVELSNQKTGQHRRAKSTSSFHELTAFLEPENEQFFVLTFGKRGDKKETRPEERQSGEGFGEVRQKRREKRKIMRKGNEKKVLLKTKEHKDAINEIVMRVVDREQLTERISEMPYQEMAHSSKTYSTDSALPLRDLGRQVNAASDLQELTRKREKSLRCEQVEFSSEESSPVSTLDFDKFVLDPGAPTSEEYATCWRRKLSSRLEDYDGFMDENVNNGDDPNSKRREESSKHEMSMVGVGEMGESIWTHKRVWKFEDFEDINTDFGLQILNELLDELVDQLA